MLAGAELEFLCLITEVTGEVTFPLGILMHTIGCTVSNVSSVSMTCSFLPSPVDKRADKICEGEGIFSESPLPLDEEKSFKGKETSIITYFSLVLN